MASSGSRHRPRERCWLVSAVTLARTCVTWWSWSRPVLVHDSGIADYRNVANSAGSPVSTLCTVSH